MTRNGNGDGRDEREDEDFGMLAADLHEQLEATEELPIDHRANRWLGEAQAVAAEIRGDVPTEVRRNGARQVIDLLESMDETGNEKADRRVERALALAHRLAEQ